MGFKLESEGELSRGHSEVTKSFENLNKRTAMVPTFESTIFELVRTKRKALVVISDLVPCFLVRRISAFATGRR